VRGKEDPTLKIGQTNTLVCNSKLATRNSQLITLNSDYVWALKDINFEVKQGEVLGIIGKNGAGKSTLLKILSKVTSPTTGSVKVKGRIASLLEVGTGFHPELSGRENIFLNGAILGMTKAEIKNKFDEIVDFAGVERYIDTPVKRYSSGMYVRLAFAVAAHLEPEILIVDEVLAVGDAEFQKKAIGKMQDVSKGEGRTVLFVSHNMGAIKSLCPTTVLLKEGVIAFQGSTHESIEKYLAGDGDATIKGIIPDNAALYGTGEAFFRKASISTIEGEETCQLYYGQSFMIWADLEINREINNGIAVIGIATRDGISLIYLESETSTRLLYDFLPGNYKIGTKISFQLLPGDYSVWLGLIDKNGKTYTWTERVLDFNVLKVAEEKDAHYSWKESHGYVTGQTKWVFEKTN